MFIKLLNFEGL